MRGLGTNRFEKVLALAEEQFSAIGTASQGPSQIKGSDRATRLLREAYQRLKANPELRRLAPDGKSTYSDPVLAAAASWADIAEEISTASVEGDDLTNAAILKWAVVGVRAWLNRGDKGKSELAAKVPSRSIRIDKPVARIAVVGDAGYRGIPQEGVIFSIREVHAKAPFDLIVHLGDVYFSAGEAEVLRHLLVPFSSIEVPFVTLCGNHDLYHGVDGYLAALQILKQPGRFFEIQTPHWNIAALDTSFGSSRTFRNDGKLDLDQLKWLKNLLAHNVNRNLVLMSHHFIISGWDEPAVSLKRQLSKLVRNRVFAWYWGHEHRCACYDKGEWGFYGASVGNGSFLEKWAPPAEKWAKPSWYSKEGRCSCDGISPDIYWPHGFLELELQPDRIEEIYHLEGGQRHKRILRK